jgi:hypothetical protein
MPNVVSLNGCQTFFTVSTTVSFAAVATVSVDVIDTRRAIFARVAVTLFYFYNGNETYTN